MRNTFSPALHLVTDRGLSLGRDILEIVEAAVAGGVTMVQLREKNCSTREFVELGRAVAGLLRPMDVPLLINDRVDVALAVGADGVHVGQSDMAPVTTRELMGPEAIVGLSVESIEDALEAEEFDVDYLGLSPVFSTATKTDVSDRLGLEGVRAIRKISRHPLVGIGGISAGNAKDVLKAGAHGIAVVSAICSADDPQEATRRLREEIEGITSIYTNSVSSWL
ncbi:MAG TPA: thiamine phosphate synthase [Desulfomicrobiaceae bacterium]|nr:thiamine phosphate synthase [Desulfomicrobiaceae bacterium]